MTLILCGSTRLINGEQIACDRRYNHPTSQRHRATMGDMTTILWDGAASSDVVPRIVETKTS